MNKHRKFELHAGLFINIGLALCMVALLFFGNTINLFSRAATYHFTLPNAEGLIPGAKVLMAGLNAGKVSRMTLDNRTRSVQVDVQIEPEYRPSIRADSLVDLNTQGILGDKVVTIEPGSLDRPLVQPGGALPVQISSGFNQIVFRGNRLLAHLDRLVLRIDDVVSGFGGSESGKKIAREAVDLLSNLKSLSAKLNTEIDPKKIDQALASLGSILKKLDRGTGTLGALLNDPSIYDEAKAVVGEANQNRVVRNLVRKSVNDAQERERKERAAQEAGQSGGE